MKPPYFLLALLCSLTFNINNAQIDIGIKTGANFATISDVKNDGTKTGYVIGVFGGSKLGKKWAIQGELLYSQQGSKLDLFDFNTEYLNIPIIFKHYVFLGLNFQVGPQFGFLLDDNIGDLSDNIETNFESKTFDLSGNVGVGYDFLLGLRLDARYQFGLTDATEGSGFSGQNRVFTLSVAYSFL